MTKAIRFFAYPGTFLLLASGVYVLLRVPAGHRSEMFAMLASTSVGVSELVVVALALINKELARAAIVAHALVGIGALLGGYGIFLNMSAAHFISGAVLFSAGLLLLQRKPKSQE